MRPNITPVEKYQRLCRTLVEDYLPKPMATGKIPQDRAKASNQYSKTTRDTSSKTTPTTGVVGTSKKSSLYKKIHYKQTQRKKERTKKYKLQSTESVKHNQSRSKQHRALQKYKEMTKIHQGKKKLKKSTQKMRTR